MPIERIHHVAYRCHEVKQTGGWYGETLAMDFVLAHHELRDGAIRVDPGLAHLRV
jgi:catechol 2,3-dioxygenase-like lactoylglutathione lyase family enzyme